MLLTLTAAVVLRRLDRRLRSLRHQVLAVTFVALSVGAAATLALTRLMVLDQADSKTVLGILGTTAVFATLLVLVASRPLGRDIAQLELTVRRIEDGERSVQTGIVRADELGHVAGALDELVVRLGTLEAERASYADERAALLSSVGHDLRTPLAALRAAIEALADGVAPDPDRYLRSMQRDVDALAGLVDDLFLLTRVESGRFEVTASRVDLAEIADEAVEALAPVAAERGIEVHCSATRGFPSSATPPPWAGSSATCSTTRSATPRISRW